MNTKTTLGIVAAGVGIIGGSALLAAGCAKKEQDPQRLPNDLFRKFDKNGDGVSKSEAEITYERTGNDRNYGFRIGDFVPYTDTITRTSWTESMARAQVAADTNNDALASWQELTGLAQTFDKDKNGTLNRDERSEFRHQYEPQEINRHTEILGQSSGLEYLPYNDYPDVNRYPTYGHTPNSWGDDIIPPSYIPPVYIPPSNGGGYYPPSNGHGNGNGDDGPTTPPYTPPSNGGGHGGGNGTGDGPSTPPHTTPPHTTPPPTTPPHTTPPRPNPNSTGNGNPSPGDFGPAPSTPHTSPPPTSPPHTSPPPTSPPHTSPPPTSPPHTSPPPTSPPHTSPPHTSPPPTSPPHTSPPAPHTTPNPNSTTNKNPTKNNF